MSLRNIRYTQYIRYRWSTIAGIENKMGNIYHEYGLALILAIGYWTQELNISNNVGIIERFYDPIVRDDFSIRTFAK